MKKYLENVIWRSIFDLSINQTTVHRLPKKPGKMKNYTQAEIAQAKRIAYQFTYGIDNIVLQRPFKYDRRTRVGNLAASFVKQMALTDDKRLAIRAIKKTRRAQKTSVAAIKDNPLVKDFLSNRSDVLRIDENRILFSGGRNHWAKSDADRRILKVLASAKG